MAGMVPFDNVVTESIVQGIPVVEYSDGRVSRDIEKMWSTLSAMLSSGSKG